MGAISFEPYLRIWRTWSPLKVKLFIWLAALNRYWTADRLAKRGMNHPHSCPLCCQEDETINHLLIGCSFSREVWHRVLQWINLQHLAPSPSDRTFLKWWKKSSRRAGAQRRKGLNTLIQLTAWFLWKHRNRCVFDGESPNAQHLFSDIQKEAHQWDLAGARALRQML